MIFQTNRAYQHFRTVWHSVSWNPALNRDLEIILQDAQLFSLVQMCINLLDGDKQTQ